MNKLKQLVIATRNPSKLDYYRSILTGVACEVIGLGEMDINGKPTETGQTAEENAEIKANYYLQRCGLPVFCEDEALYVDFLPESAQPGTHIRRINGVDEVDDDRLLQHWEAIIAKVPAKKRTGRWHIAYALAVPNRKIRVLALDHPIMFFSPSSKVRLPGWPMSSLEGSVLFDKPNSEQTVTEKEIAKSRTAQELISSVKELVQNTE
ncbi:MAG: non-canonical purine NTP pyrophosphatase [bacterium]